MPGISPLVLSGLVSRAKSGDPSAMQALQAAGYDIAGRAVGVQSPGLTGQPMGVAPTRARMNRGVPSTAQTQRANTYAQMLRRMVGR